jgi:hypothetical protein
VPIHLAIDVYLILSMPVSCQAVLPRVYSAAFPQLLVPWWLIWRCSLFWVNEQSPAYGFSRKTIAGRYT